MSKKIVICPSFGESHLIEFHIRNLIDTINPDKIIYCEGLFQSGPENKGSERDFIQKWCNLDYLPYLPAFDYNDLLKIADKYKNLVEIRPMEFNSMSTDENFIKAMSSIADIVDVGDYIFPLEPDAFLLEDDKTKIEVEISKLLPGQGLKVKWVDFLETQYYTENINILQPKHRRFVYRFDEIENYKASINGFVSQNYPKLKYVDNWIVYHYSWFRPGKWKEFRFDHIKRKDPQYWKDFEEGLQEIRLFSEKQVSVQQEIEILNDSYFPDKILIRPSRIDEARWAKFIDISHPKHIENHPNFVK